MNAYTKKEIPFFITFTIFFLCFHHQTNAKSFPDDSTLTYNYLPPKPLLKSYTKGTKRHFPSIKTLEIPDNTELQSYEDLVLAMGYMPDTAQTEEEKEVHAKATKVEEEGRFIDFLDFNLAHELPVGIQKQIGNIKYTIIIDSLIFDGDWVEVVAMMSLAIPEKNKKLAFKGRDIKFSATGGFGQSGRMELITEIPIKVSNDVCLVLKSGYDSGESFGTYVSFDCNGFKEMGVQAEIAFSRDLLIPYGGNNTAQGSTQNTESFQNTTNSNACFTEEDLVRTQFQIVVGGWNDIVTEITLPPFQVNGLNDFNFSLKRVILDFSGVRNVTDFQLPEGYNSDWLPSPSSPLWQGVYISAFEVGLPSYFNKNDGNGETRIGGYEIVIDRTGFSGTIAANNILSVGEGNANGWAFSLDSLSISIQANQFSAGYFDGGIQLPIAPEEFAYTCTIDPNNDLYNFQIKYTADINFDALIAKGTIKETSYLDVTLKDGQFLPRAVLNGHINIDSDKIKVPNVEFEALTIQTIAPYVTCENIGFGDDGQDFSGFPIVIKDIGIKENGPNTGLQMTVMVNLSKGDISGEAGLVIWGTNEEENGKQKWKYKNLQVTKIKVEVDASTYSIKGLIDFFEEDQTYGRGFKGNLKLTLMGGKAAIDAEALFGNTNTTEEANGFRYWYVDALFLSNKGIALGSDAFKIYALGGGLYKHMRQATKEQASGFGSRGKTRSGLVYVPDENISLGLKAGVFVGGESEKAFNGGVAFEMTFNRSGGLSYLGFKGTFMMMSVPEFSTENLINLMTVVTEGGTDPLPEDAPIAGQIIIAMDFENRALHAELAAVVNSEAFSGRGRIVLHFEPGYWYIYLGTPQDRIAINLTAFEVNAYLMIGDRLPDRIPPPPEVIRILRLEDEYKETDDTKVFAGSGFAFGAGLTIGREMTFAIFYASFKIGAGFDVLVKKYPQGVRCKGQTDIGVNGWYARGQAYAFFEGAIGIDISKRIFGKKIQIRAEILKIAAAVLLQAELPNPVWMKGTVGGEFSVLGGLVKGNCKFEAELGEKCELVGGSILASINLIDDISPAEGDADVDVFTAPQVVFSMPIEKPFEMVDVDDIKKTYRSKLVKFEVLHNGIPLKGTYDWNSEKDVLVIRTEDVLPPTSRLVAKAAVQFEERKNGRWEAVQVDGTVFLEEREANFTTGEAPPYIPEHNIAYSYPIPKQLHFHQDEVDKAYIQLKQGQPYLFQLEPIWDHQEAHWIQGEEDFTVSDFNYDFAERRVYINIPSLQNGKVYTLDMVNVPKQTEGKIDANVQKEMDSQGGDFGEIAVRKRKAEGTVENYFVKSILGPNGYHFQTSIYSTANEKLNNLKFGLTFKNFLYPEVDNVITFVEGKEMFDQFELQVTDSLVQPLIQIEGVLRGNKWHDQNINPLIYEGYPFSGLIQIEHRNPQILGVPPSKAVFIAQSPDDKTLSTEEATRGQATPFVSQANLIYDLPREFEQDFRRFQDQVAGLLARGYKVPNRISDMLSSRFPSIPYGKYDITLRHILPGINRVSAEKTITINIKRNVK